MARPIKSGLDYFPQDTDIHSDRKIRRLISELGANGYLVYDYIKCLIYGDNGYFIYLNDDLVFDISDFLHCGLDSEFVNKVISFCFKQNLLHEGLFKKYKILTSHGIQKRYLKAKRDAVISEKYLIIAEETQVIAAETPINSEESTQSKVKEIKVNKSKKDERKKDFQASPEQLSKFEKFNEWIETNTPFVKTMEKPIIIEEYLKIIGEIPYSKNKKGDGLFLKVPPAKVKEYLESIENRLDYQKKYSQPYLCVKNWWLKDQLEK